MLDDQNQIRKLLQQFAAGRTEVFDAVYDMLAPRLFACAMAILCNRQDSEDVVQSVFVRALSEPEKLARMKYPEEYLMRAAHNHALDRIKLGQREHLRRQKKGLERYLQQVPDAEQKLLTKEQLQILETQFKKLDADDRELVALHLFEDMTYEQLARYYNITIHVVRFRYEKSIKKLQEYFHGRE
ncbi:RNA polymerase sigma factor [Planctomycetota bacterium]